jgi:hypothetical protein
VKHRQYLDGLRALPAFRHLSRRRLAGIARLVDVVELPAGTRVLTRDREVVLTLEPVRAVVVDRRALVTLPELAAPAAGDTSVRSARRSPDARCPR